MVSKDPFTGHYTPTEFDNADIESKVCHRRIIESAASLEELLATREEAAHELPLSPQMQQALRQPWDEPYPPSRINLVQKSQLRSIAETVRTTVLEWSLRLEAEGILGEGMTFSPQEKNIASRDASSLTPSVNILYVEQVTGSQIQQGTVGSTQLGSFSSLDLQAVSQLIQELKIKLPELGLVTDDNGAIESDIATVEAQLSSPRPKMEVVKECLRSIRNIAEGTTGSMVAAGIIQGITKLLGG